MVVNNQFPVRSCRGHTTFPIMSYFIDNTGVRNGCAIVGAHRLIEAMKPFKFACTTLRYIHMLKGNPDSWLNEYIITYSYVTYAARVIKLMKAIACISKYDN